jgi:cyclase
MGGDEKDRRALLRAGLGGAFALPLASRVLAQVSNPDVREIAEGVSVITGGGANVVALRGPDGAVLVDSGLAGEAPAVLDLALALTRSRKISTLFNTNWRPEHTGGNDLAAARGARIVAHENTKLWMGTEIWVRWEDKTYAPRDPKARPTQTFYTTGSMPLGKETADYGYMLQAHTDGDAYVFFRKANVLVAGGVACAAGWPIIDWATGGWIGQAPARRGGPGGAETFNSVEVPTYGGMIGGLQTLMNLANDDTKIVPCRGPVLTKADLKAQIEMYAAVAQRLRELMYKGQGLSEAVAADPTREFNAKMGDPKLFVSLAFQSLWGHLTPDA